MELTSVKQILDLPQEEYDANIQVILNTFSLEALCRVNSFAAYFGCPMPVDGKLMNQYVCDQLNPLIEIKRKELAPASTPTAVQEVQSNWQSEFAMPIDSPETDFFGAVDEESF